MPHIEVRGAKFHVLQHGSGPDVVLLHAVTGNLAVWVFIGILEELAKNFRVTAYDLRGHGLSDATPTGYTSAELAEDFAALHEALDLKPALLVGHSYGGVTAMHAALLHPEKVRGLVLSDPFFSGLKHIEPNYGRTHVWTDLQATFAAAGLDLGDETDFTRLFELVANLTPEQKETIRAKMGPNSVRWLTQLPKLAHTTCGRDIFDPAGLTAEALKSIRQPVVALYDEHSPFMATCGWLKQNLPDCAVEIVPGAGHLAPVQNAGVFTEMVSRHLTALDRRT